MALKSRNGTGDNRLVNEGSLIVSPTLAHALGLNEAIFVQQIYYWLQNESSGRTVNGRRWIFNSIRQWESDNFPFWSISTVRRTANSLVKKGIVLVRKDLNKLKFDRTKWYTIDYDALLLILNKSSDSEWTFANGQIQKLDTLGMDDTIPDTTADITTDTSPSLEGVINDYETTISTDSSFDVWWSLYGKKQDEDRCRKQWGRLTEAEKAEAIEHSETYVSKGQGSVYQYRFAPTKYLKVKAWNDQGLLNYRKNDPGHRQDKGMEQVEEALRRIKERDRQESASRQV